MSILLRGDLTITTELVNLHRKRDLHADNTSTYYLRTGVAGSFKILCLRAGVAGGFKILCLRAGVAGV